MSSIPPPPGYEPPGYEPAGYQPPGYQPQSPPPPAPPRPAGPPGMAPPPGYPHHYYQMQVEHPAGTTVLVLGILSLVLCGVLGPFAWSKGNEAIRDCELSPGRYSNRGSIQAGRICGIVASCLLVLQIVLIVGVIAAGSMS